MRILSLLISFFCLSLFTVEAQTNSSLWTEIEETEIGNSSSRPERTVTPSNYKTLRLDGSVLRRILDSAPTEGEGSAKTSDVFEVMMSDGKTESFHLIEYEMMEPGLAAKFPEIKTYRGVGVNDPLRRIRVDWTSSGLNAMLYLPGGLAYVRPYAKGDQEHYLSYYEREMPENTEPFECGAIFEKAIEQEGHAATARAGDCQLRTYRMAIAVTAEFAVNTLGASTSGTPADETIVNNHVVTSMNQVNGWYERDVASRFILISNQTDIYYFNAASDPYTSFSLAENQTNLDATIGTANYDIGHLLHGSGFGSGGVANLNALCSNTLKARGRTNASASGINQPRYLKVLAHELGHQFGAGHTQNENCQRSAASAMEPGAGTTIMSYATSNCANQVQSVPDYYFHSISIQQMSARTTSTTCAAILPSANSAPTVSAGLDKTVPSSTPLLLEAVASDPDGDPLTYTWEQFDNDAATAIPPQPTNTLGPQFRSLPPSVESGRYLPNLNAVLSGTTPTWEVLPSVARQMEFRVTVRDNSTNSISCTDEDNIVITTVAAGPFEVNTASSAGTVWFEGQNVTVDWNTAGTQNAPVSCANVDILLSYDGGLTYPTTLATGVPNSGSSTITVPNGITTTARLLVRCSDNIFYNVSASNFEIQVAQSPTFTLDLPITSSSACPGTPVSVPVNTTSISGFTGTVALSILNGPGGANASFASSSIAAGSGTTLTIDNTTGLAAGDYTFTVRGTSGTIIREQNYVLTIEEPAGTTTLDMPANAAIDLGLLPNLSWIAKPNASSYTVQLSQDVNFTSLLVNETLSANNYTLTTALTALTTYYWRVQTTTPCGVTPWSTMREFTTANCLAPQVQNTPVAISPSGTPTITSVITMTQPGTIDDVSITVTGTHTWVADLDVELIGPGGSPVVTLWNNLCGSNDNFDLSFSDNATTPIASAPCNPLGQGGTFIPQEPLAAFFGAPIAGDWTLRIMDDADQDGGTLTSWSLNFCAAASVPLPVEMLSFDAKADKQHVLLDWKTANEINNTGFEVERRAEYEDDFKTVGLVDAAADVQQVNEYTYVDSDVKSGVRYYYRLRQNDVDGNFDYSEVRTAMIDRISQGIQVFPNPTHGELSVVLDVEATTQTEVALYDLNGRLVLKQISEGPQFTMDLQGIIAGIYVLKAKHTGNEEIVKLIVD